MKTIFKKTLSIAIMVSMIISLFAVPTMASQPELPDWEILMNPVYEMGFEPDSDGKFYDMPAGFEGRQEVPTEANPEGILLGDNNAYDKVISVGKTLNSGTNETKIASYWATDVLYSAFSKGDAANDINTGASGNVNDYCVKLTDASSNSGPGLLKIDFPQAYGAADDSYNKYRVEFDWKWQAYYDNDGVLTPTAQPSASGATLLRFYIGDKTLNLKSKSASEASDARGPGALYFVDAFGMYASNQITDAADVDKITETAAQIPESESGKWIHVTVDFDFKAGTIDLVMDGESTTTQMSTTIVNGNSDFAKGISAMAILGSTSSERRVSYADNVKVTPISRPSVPLTSGERMGNASYEMDFNPDASGNFYDAPLGYDDREVVATTSSLKMAKGETWEGTCTKKLTPRFDSTTSYSEFVQDGTTNNYYIKSVDNEGSSHSNAGSGTAIKVDFGKTFGGADDSHRRYRVELDWKWSNISGNQLAGITGGTLFNFYTPSGKKLYLKTKSGSDATNPGGIFFDKQTNHITGLTATSVAPQVAADKSNKWLHLTFDFDFANSLVDLTIEGEDYTGKVSATVTDSAFAGGITGLSMWGSSKADTRINYMDNVVVTPIMTKEPTIKADGNKLMWKAVSGASSYNVYVANTADGEKQAASVKKLDTTSNPGYVIATLNFADDSAKYYTVTATSANKGESYHSNSVCVTPKNIISDVDFEITSAADGKSTAKVSVKVEAAKGFDKNIKLMAAVYDGKELADFAESLPAEFARGEDGELELTLNDLTTIPTSEMSIKFFIWDEDITPVKESEKLTFTQWREKLENSGHD